MKFMDKFAAWLERVLMPIASKLGSQRHLAALRDGFIAYLPISLIGAVGTMFLNVLLKPDSLIGKELMKIYRELKGIPEPEEGQKEEPELL